MDDLMPDLPDLDDTSVMESLPGERILKERPKRRYLLLVVCLLLMVSLMAGAGYWHISKLKADYQVLNELGINGHKLQLASVENKVTQLNIAHEESLKTLNENLADSKAKIVELNTLLGLERKINTDNEDEVNELLVEMQTLKMDNSHVDKATRPVMKQRALKSMSITFSILGSKQLNGINMLLVMSDGVLESLEVNDSIDGWMLTGWNNREATFVNRDKTQKVKL